MLRFDRKQQHSVKQLSFNKTKFKKKKKKKTRHTRASLVAYGVNGPPAYAGDTGGIPRPGGSHMPQNT